MSALIGIPVKSIHKGLIKLFDLLRFLNPFQRWQLRASRHDLSFGWRWLFIKTINKDFGEVSCAALLKFLHLHLFPLFIVHYLRCINCFLFLFLLDQLDSIFLISHRSKDQIFVTGEILGHVQFNVMRNLRRFAAARSRRLICEKL